MTGERADAVVCPVQEAKDYQHGPLRTGDLPTYTLLSAILPVRTTDEVAHHITEHARRRNYQHSGHLDRLSPVPEFNEETITVERVDLVALHNAPTGEVVPFPTRVTTIAGTSVKFGLHPHSVVEEGVVRVPRLRWFS